MCLTQVVLLHQAVQRSPADPKGASCVDFVPLLPCGAAAAHCFQDFPRQEKPSPDSEGAPRKGLPIETRVGVRLGDCRRQIRTPVALPV